MFEMSRYDTDELLPRLVAFPTNVAIDDDMYGIGVVMLRLPAHRPPVGLEPMLSPATDAYVDTSDMFDEVCQLLDTSTPLLDTASDVAEETDEVAAEVLPLCAFDLDTDPPRLFDDGLVSGDVELEDDEELLVALVDVPRDFFAGGSSRCIELRLPWDGLLLFSVLERLLPLVPDEEEPPADADWPDGVGELFTGTLRRSPIVALAIIPRVYLATDRWPVSLFAIDFTLSLVHRPRRRRSPKPSAASIIVCTRGIHAPTDGETRTHTHTETEETHTRCVHTRGERYIDED